MTTTTSALRPQRLLLAALALAAPAAAQTGPDVLFTEIPSSPTSLIPGASGARFDGFGDIDVSPNGAHWTLHAKSTASSSFDDYFLVDGELILRESISTLPWDSSQAWRGGWSRVNDAGQVALAAESTGAPRYLVRGENAGQGPWTVLRTNGDAVAGAAGATWTQFFAASITSDARIGFAGNVSGGRRGASFDGTTVALTGTTVPGGSSSGAPLSQIEPGDFGFHVSADGSTWATLGSVGNPNALVVNGQVALEVGQVVPGSGYTRGILRITGQYVDPAGRSFGWGLNSIDGHDWVVRDGVVIAEEFDPIVPGSSEVWGQTQTLSPAFLHAAGNRAGDYLVVGTARGSSGAQIMVKNGQEEVIRSGALIDVDGNGLFDDNTQLGGFRELAGWGDDGSLYAIVFLQTLTFGNLGEAVIRIDVQGSGLGAVYCASAPNSTGGQAQLALTGSDVVSANDLQLTCSSLPQSSFGYFLTSRAQASVPGAGGSQGTLCLGGAVGRGLGGGVQNSGASGQVMVSADLTALPTPTGPVAAIAGETWSFQYWYRDANPAVTSNLSPGVELTLR